MTERIFGIQIVGGDVRGCKIGDWCTKNGYFHKESMPFDLDDEILDFRRSNPNTEYEIRMFPVGHEVYG